MGTIAAHMPRKGWRFILRVSVGDANPSIVIANVSLTTAASRLAVSLAVSGVTQTIEAGNWLLFTAPNGEEVIVKVTETALSGATSLVVAPAETAIAVRSVAQFPPELLHRSSADYIASAATSTLKTDGLKQTVATEISASILAPGFFHHLNPGLKICHDAFAAMDTVWAMLEYEPPSVYYSRGRVILGKAILADANIFNSISADFVTADIELKMSGAVEDNPPLLAP